MALIWLIEDNVAFRNATRTALELQGEHYVCQVFASCEKALEELKRGKKPDVILQDVELPGMDGIEGIQHIRRYVPDVNLLILTVFEDDDKIFRAICAGASGYLLKLEPFKNILAAIELALEGGAPMNPHIAKRVLGMFSKLAPPKQDFGLTDREQFVLEMMVEGLAKKQIADKLGVTTHTANYFVRCIYRKLHVNCQTAAVSTAMRSGLVDKSGTVLPGSGKV